MQPRGLIIFEAVQISQGVVASTACLYGAVGVKVPLVDCHLRYQMSLDWAFRLCEGLLTNSTPGQKPPAVRL